MERKQFEPASQASGDFEIQQITDSAGPTYFVRPPATTEEHVVYRMDLPGGAVVPQLLVHDLTAGQTTQITSFSGDYSLGDAAICDGRVVYQAAPSQHTPVNVFVYEIASGVTQQITNFTTLPTQFNPTTPAISGDLVAFRADPPGGQIFPNLFVHDLSTGYTRQITDFSGTYSLGDPAIHDGRVVYMASPSGLTPVNVFVYDVASQRTTQITNYSPVPNQYNPTTPDIWGDLVVYHADYPHLNFRNFEASQVARCR